MTQNFLDPQLLQRLGRLHLIARTVVEGFLTGLHVSPYHGFSSEFAQYRQYIPGDDVRYVDWRVFARTDRYYIKQFEEDTNLNCYFLLDASGSMAFQPDKLTKLAYASYLIASLAYLQMKQRDNAGLYVFNDKFSEVIPPRNGQRHLSLLLHALESARAFGSAEIGAMALSAALNFKRRGLVILISDLYDDPSALMRALTRIRYAGHQVIVFHLLDAAEQELNTKGTVEFVDLETGSKLIGDAARLRREYQEKLAVTLEYYRREFTREDLDYVLIDTSRPLDLALYAYLKRRQGKA